MAGDDRADASLGGEAQLRARLPLLRRRPLLATPEVSLLLDPDGRIVRVGSRYASARLAALAFAPGRSVHEILHDDCDDDCDFAHAWRRAWSSLPSGVPVEWLYISRSDGGALKFRLQPVGYACGALFGDAVADYTAHSVLFVQDLDAPGKPGDNGPGADAVRLENAVLYRQRRRTDQDPDLVATMDQRLRAITGRLLLAREDERRHIASELHDSLGQTLSILRYEIDGLVDRLADDGEAGEAARRAQQHVLRALGSLRAATRGLREEQSGEQGLVDAMHALCADFRAVRPAITLDFECTAAQHDLSLDLCVAIYRIAQEALNNIAQHSGAKRACVALVVDDRTVRLEIDDDGKGLPPHSGDRAGLGLITMRERAERLGGVFALRSAPGDGCTIRVTWQLDPLGWVT